MANKEFATADLYEAAALSLDNVVIRMDENEGRYIFIFQVEAKQQSDEYWSGRLAGNLKKYAEKIQQLKDWIFSRKRAIGN